MLTRQSEESREQFRDLSAYLQATREEVLPAKSMTNLVKRLQP